MENESLNAWEIRKQLWLELQYGQKFQNYQAALAYQTAAEELEKKRYGGYTKAVMDELRANERAARIQDWMIGIAGAILIGGIGLILAASFYQTFIK